VSKVRAFTAAHRKSVTAVVGLVLGTAIAVWGTGNQWVTFGIAAATALGVYAVPNR